MIHSQRLPLPSLLRAPLRLAIVVGACAALMVSALPAAAGIAMVGHETTVNQNEAFQPHNPVSYYRPDGSFTVVWENDQLGIYARNYSAAGVPAGPEKVLVANERLKEIPGVGPITYRHEPVVVGLPGGGFYMAWSEEHSIYYVQMFQEWREVQSRQIFGQRFNRQGNAVSAPVRLSAEDEAFHTRPQIALHPRRGMVVTWEAMDANPDVTALDGVFARHLDLSGQPSAAAVRLNDSAGATAERPRIAANGEGRFLVVWEGCCTDGSGMGVSGRMLDDDGSPLGPSFQINSTTAGSQRRPAVASDPWSHFLVVWQGHVDDPDYPEYLFSARIFGQMISNHGAEMGGELKITESMGTTQAGPSLVGSPFGGYMVVWQDFNRNFPLGVSAIQVDAFGNLGHEQFPVSSSQIGARVHSSIATNIEGEFFVTWEGYQENELAILGQRLSGADEARRRTLGLRGVD